MIKHKILNDHLYICCIRSSGVQRTVVVVVAAAVCLFNWVEVFFFFFFFFFLLDVRYVRIYLCSNTLVCNLLVQFLTTKFVFYGAIFSFKRIPEYFQYAITSPESAYTCICSQVSSN